MRDCANAEMRDALPDLMHGTLPSERRAEVRAHVDGCGACRAELALLERVRAAARIPAVRTDRIVSSLPVYEPTPAWRRIVRSPVMRIAAAMVLLAGGATVLLRSGRDASRTVVDSTLATPPAPAELALGENFTDMSDSALVALVDAIGRIDATLSEEPENIPVPLIPTEGL